MSDTWTVRMLLRHLASAKAAATTLAVLVLITTGLLAAIPGTLDRIGGAELRYQVAALSPKSRFPTSRILAEPPIGPGAADAADPLPAAAASTWGATDADLQAIRRSAPEPLRNHLARARYTAYTGVMDLPQPPPGTGEIGDFKMILAADPRLSESAYLTGGTWPEPVVSGFPLNAPVGIALSAATAQRMGWKIGEVRTPLLDPTLRTRLVLTGTFDQTAGSGDFWTLNRSILLPNVRRTPNSDIVTGTAFVNAGSWPAAAGVFGGPAGAGPASYLWVYYPLDVSGVPISQVGQLRAQLDSFTDGTHPFGRAPGSPLGVASIRLASQTAATLSQVLTSVSSADSVLSLLASGPSVAALAVLVLGCRLLSNQRRRAFALISARGASGGLLRSTFAVEGLLLSVPAAAIGITVAFLFLPPDHLGTALVLPVAAAAAPAAVLAGSLSRSRIGRPEVAGERSRRVRATAEIAVLATALASTTVLLLSGRGSGLGLDPLAVLTPVLICLAVCVLLLRVLPVPIRAVNGVFRERRGLVHFLGSARSLRDRSGLAPVLGLVIGVAMAVLAAVLLSTLRAGVVTASRTEIGGDLRVDQLALLPADISAVNRIPGVTRVAASDTVDSVQLKVDGLEQGVQVYLVDSDALPFVQADVGGAVPIPPGMRATIGTDVPVVVSPDLAGRNLAVDDRTLRVVGSGAATAGLGRATTWVVADKRFLGAFSTGDYLPQTLLLQLDQRADPAAIGEAIGQRLPDAVVGNPASRTATLLAAPVIGGLQLILIVALAVMAALCGAAILMTAVANTPARTQLVAVIRILGMPGSAVRRLVGWELGPGAVAAVLGGTATGIGLCLLVTRVIDLRPFTGGGDQPVVVVAGATLVELLGGFLLLVLAAVTISSRFAARAGLAAELRFGDPS